MAVVGSARVSRRYGKWGATVSRDGHITYEVVYEVEVDDPSDGPQVVLSATGIPAWYSQYSTGNDTDTSAYATNFRVLGRASPNGLLWLVAVTFSTDVGEAQRRDDSGNIQINPELWRTKWQIAFVSRQAPCGIRAQWVENSNGTEFKQGWSGLNVENRPFMQISNSAPMPVEPDIMIDDTRMIVEAQYYKRDVDVDELYLYKDAVNSDAVTVNTYDYYTNSMKSMSFAAGEMKVMSIAVTEAELEDISVPQASGLNRRNLYNRINISFAIDALGWDIEIPDVGDFQRAVVGDEDGEGGTVNQNDVVSGRIRYTRVKGFDGIIPNAKLDGTGRALDTIDNRPFEDPVKITYRVYDRKAFADIGIPGLVVQ